MKTLLLIILGTHILSGSLALITGLIAILARKGRKLHTTAGLVFFISMIGVAITAIILSAIHPNSFLFHIAVFSFYMTYGGYRSVKNKSQKPSVSDWFFVAVLASNTIMMWFSGDIILIVFGILSAMMTLNDLRIFISVLKGAEPSASRRLVRHISLMSGAYISTLTAFMVVNLQGVHPAWLIWLLPTILGTPLISYTAKKYLRKPKPSSL